MWKRYDDDDDNDDTLVTAIHVVHTSPANLTCTRLVSIT
jgi:hypothetical protein